MPDEVLRWRAWRGRLKLVAFILQTCSGVLEDWEGKAELIRQEADELRHPHPHPHTCQTQHRRTRRVPMGFRWDPFIQKVAMALGLLFTDGGPDAAEQVT